MAVPLRVEILYFKRGKFIPLLLIIVILAIFPVSKCRMLSSEPKCALLYSGKNFSGKKLPFRDNAQSTNLLTDFRASKEGWKSTGSIKIQKDCSMKICDEPYLDGNCFTLMRGSYGNKTSQKLTDVNSASCLCKKKCKCSDIFMKKSTCARGYFAGGCKICNSLYKNLLGSQNFSLEESEKVTAFKIRKGCTLKLYPEKGFQGNFVSFYDETVEEYSEYFGSYQCECNDDLYEPIANPENSHSDPELIDVPSTLDDVIKMLADERYSNHSGLKAALTSLQNGRSSRNAYILLLGSKKSGKSTAINLLFDNPIVTKPGESLASTTGINEFRIPIPINKLGIRNSELRVIDTPGLGDELGLTQNGKFLATLDAYLSSHHEELKDRIPNVVLIFHRFNDDEFDKTNSSFIRMLRGLDSFRPRITDENFSNIIFVLSYFGSETERIQRRPDEKLRRFKEIIENYSLFPQPIIISVAENKGDKLPMVDGYFKLPNNELYPKNLLDNFKLVTQNGGDPIGFGIFRADLRNLDSFNVTYHTLNLFEGEKKVAHYLKLMSNAKFVFNQTDTFWDRLSRNKKMSFFRNRFPNILPHLQRELSIRNVNKQEDLPLNAEQTLDLFTSVKHNETTYELLELIQIKPRTFSHDVVAGFNYHILEDSYLRTSAAIATRGLRASEIGFKIPQNINCELYSSPITVENYHFFNSTDEYVQYRLKSLNVDESITTKTFGAAPKPGFNIKWKSTKENSCTLTKEYRLFECGLNKDGIQLSPKFNRTVKNLPEVLLTDHKNVEIWKTFFNNYGTHLVKSVYGGGTIEVEVDNDKKCTERIAKGLMNVVNYAEEKSFVFRDEEEDESFDNNQSINATEHKENKFIRQRIPHVLKFIGGDPIRDDLTNLKIEKASKLLAKWKNSLKYNPAILTTDVKLIPLSQIAKQLGQSYSFKIGKAAALLFRGKLNYVQNSYEVITNMPAPNKPPRMVTNPPNKPPPPG